MVQGAGCGGRRTERRPAPGTPHPAPGPRPPAPGPRHPAPCSICGKTPVTFVRYSGAHLCREHFVDFVRRKVSRELRRQVRLPDGATVAVAVSGGKDSMVALRILHDLLGPRRGIRLVAITVDEGIRGYRPPALKVVARHCRETGIEHRVVSFREAFDLTMDSTRRCWGAATPCTYCGVLRRHCLNRAAREMGADVLATGLNLDDTAQSILMNICRGDVERLARLGPHERVREGLVRRIQPLRQVTDKESFLYATLMGYPVHHSVCPYAADAMRNRFRELVASLEDSSPGTRFCILNSHDALRPSLEEMFPPARLERCPGCGEPSAEGHCAACRLARALKRGAGCRVPGAGNDEGSGTGARRRSAP
ncbi:MAG: TIGR00269 family protein [Euryarchaeota archaeon]|nr:TIGR00269 family protein [Euryarchaeota archaeon]